MTSRSLTDLLADPDDQGDRSLWKEAKSLTDLTLNQSSTDVEIYSTNENELFDLVLENSLTELDTEMLEFVIAKLESRMKAINSERLELESQLESTNTCLTALENIPKYN